MWTTRPPTLIGIEIGLFGETAQLSRELVQVAVFLSGFAAVYFAVYTASDPNLRSEFFEDTAAEMRENLAVRVVDRLSASS